MAVVARENTLTGLVADLRRQVLVLEDDLRARSEDVAEFHAALDAEYQQAKVADRTAATYDTWRDDRVTQVAAAWVLSTVFVRYCEDNGLIEWPFIAGHGERLAEAEGRHEAYFREHPQNNDRDWLIAAFDHLSAAHPTAAGLFDKRHNALWEITPSFEAASDLLKFWRRKDDEGDIRYDFDGVDTRFLGDLYQDLSEHARKTYALLQTPVFVEEFILDLTLTPALEEFGLRGLRTIDPACGSGHFLLGIFRRLLAKWRDAEPGTDDWSLIRRSLDSVHGCDKNPFAASIARFRLLLAALDAAGVKRLDKAEVFPINVAVGDSLMHGEGVKNEQYDLLTPPEAHTYRTEDVAEFIHSCHLLKTGSYHVVVGNPPYITVKDKQENENYRERYKEVCAGKYALSAPFAMRMFQLAIRRDGSERDAGFAGQITANSFMKREFGKKLIEQFFPTVSLTHVIDTSGAYIPGHGTPTVILLGRNHMGRSKDAIRAVLGSRGEPSQPGDPSRGIVWLAIVEQVYKPGSESSWVSVRDADRSTFAMHPWSISGGGASELLASVEAIERDRLRPRIMRIGFYGVIGADEVMVAPAASFRRARTEGRFHCPLTVGDEVRDWDINSGDDTFHPYDADRNLVPLDEMPSHSRRIWAFRTELGNRATFTKGTYFSDERPWYEWHQIPKDIGASRWSLAFAFVATHNHFVLDRGGKVFKQSAPVIKLPEGASEGDHLALLGVLNSSTACFWLKQVCHGKGNGGVNEGYRGDEWEEFYEFTGTKLQEFPLPAALPLDLGRALDSLAQQLAEQEPAAVCDREIPTRAALDAARGEHERIRGRMIAAQEELDWWVYGSYGLLNDAELAALTVKDLDSVPKISLGERAFELVLARKVKDGDLETAWFARHGSAPITEVPSHWPEWYRDVVQARIDVIEKRRDIALIERPECKRRWATQPWEKKEAEALRNWLLDRCEADNLWFGLRDGMRHPRTLTVSQLADQFRDDADMNSVAELYATDHLGKRDMTLAQVLEQIVVDQHVPYLAALRYKDTGLRKRAQWEEVWEKQRQEDRDGTRLDIAVPPKYGSGDFRKTSYWSQRGKLDVPKERFISYPDANPDADPTLLLGWAGWDNKDQAQALVNLVNDRTEQAGWTTERLVAPLAGLAELMPWVWQWHGEPDADWGGTPAEEYQAYLDEQRAKHQLTEQDLRAWRPVPSARGRRVKKDG